MKPKDQSAESQIGSSPLLLAGTPREQSRNRRALLTSLRKFEAKSLAQARTAAAARAALEACDRATLARGGGEDVCKLLSAAFENDCGVCGNPLVAKAVRALIGAPDDYVARELLRGRDRDEILAKRERLRQPDDEVPALTADAALAEAGRIAAQASVDAIEIDWTEDPSSEREAALRVAMIRAIERDRPDHEGTIRRLLGQPQGESHMAHRTRAALNRLAPSGAEFVGSDLFAALERWECEEEDRQNEAIRRRELREMALRELDERGRGER